MKKIVKISTVYSLVLTSLFFVYAQDANANISTESDSESGTSVSADAGVRVSPLMMQARMAEEKKKMQMDAKANLKSIREDNMQVISDMRSKGKDAIDQMKNERQDAVHSMMNGTTSVSREDRMKMGLGNSSTTMNSEMKLEIMQKRDEMRTSIQAKQEEFANILKDKKDEIMQKIQDKKLELKNKLSVIKDQRKVNLTLNINDRFQALNKKVVDSLNEAINRKEDVVNKLKIMSADLNAQGKDTTDINSQITVIEGKIAEARNMVLAQSSKVYTIDITNETDLKANVEKTNSTIKTDVNVLQNFTKNISDLIRNVADTINNK